MAFSCVASRKTPQAAGEPQPLNKLFCFYPKKGLFWEPLGNYCMNRLPVLYYEGRRLNGLWSPFGIETHPSHMRSTTAEAAKWPV